MGDEGLRVMDVVLHCIEPEKIRLPPLILIIIIIIIIIGLIIIIYTKFPFSTLSQTTKILFGGWWLEHNLSV